MSKRIKLPIGKSEVRGRSYGANNMLLQNYYAEIPSGGNRNDVILLPTQGARKVDDFGLTDGKIFATYVDRADVLEKLYVVAGEKGGSTSPNLYEVSFTGVETASITNRGTLSNFGGAYESMISGNDEYVVIMEVGTGEGYTWNKTTTTLAAITDADYPANQTPTIPTDSLTYLDGYWIVTERGGNRFFISDLLDPTSWTATNFASAEQSGDNIVRGYAIRNELWLFGVDSTEVWQNTGNPDFPFEPIPNAVFNIGLAHAFSLQQSGGDLLFMGINNTGNVGVMKFTGFELSKLSIPEIDYQIQNNVFSDDVLSRQISTLGSNVYSFVYSMDGHVFYGLSFNLLVYNESLENYPFGFGSSSNVPTDTSSPGRLFDDDAPITYVVDVTTNLWHTRRSVNVDDPGPPRDTNLREWHYRNIVFLRNNYYALGDCYRIGFSSPLKDNIYRLTNDAYVDIYESTGPSYDIVVRAFVTPYYTENRNRIFWHSFELDVEMFAQDKHLDIEEEVYFDLFYSDNQGVDWRYVGRKSPTIETILSSSTDTPRIKWNRLGRSRDRIYLVKARTDVRNVILGAYGQISIEDGE